MSWVSIALFGSGHYSNKLVEWANGGAMPVAMQKEDVLFVVGSAYLGVKFFSSAKELSRGWQPLTKDTKLRILTDRIPLSFTLIKQDRLPRWLSATFDFWEIPTEKEGIASIGDLLLWSGRWLMLPLFPIILPLFLWKLLCRLRKKK